MEPRNMSRNRRCAERWTHQVSDVERGFTRRCGKRDPVDKSLCMHAYGHEGRHAWEPRTSSRL